MSEGKNEMYSFFSKLFVFVAVFTVICGCAEKEFDPNDPKKSYGIAKEPYDDESFDMAITRLGEFKSRFPYSQFAVEAELLVANCHFELEQYTEAAFAYEHFVKLHPTHPKIDFAMFRIGESYWKDSPEEIDREQEYTGKAIAEWEKLIARMPENTYSKEAEKLVKLGKRRIAESVEFVSDFYCKQELYHSCAYRFIQLADEYPEFKDLRVKALEKASKALEILADQKAEDPESDKNLYFKNLSAKELREKAANLKSALAKYKKMGD